MKYHRLLLLLLLSTSLHSHAQKLLKDIASADASSNINGDLINYGKTLVKGDTMFFMAQDTSLAYYNLKNIWFTTGTANNTTKVTNGTQTIQPFITLSYTFLTSFQSKVFYKDITNADLYATDGNTNTLIKTFTNSTILKASAINDWLYVFVSNNTTNVLELWKTDGTNMNTSKITDIYTGTHTFDETRFLNTDDKIYFNFSTNTSGSEPWVTDGTAGGSRILKDIVPGSGSSYPISFMKAGNTVFFSAGDASFQRKLWKTDGTEEGTVVVANEIDGSANFSPFNQVVFNNFLYFRTGSNKLYKTDGNTITLIATNIIISGEIVVANSLMYYVKLNTRDIELWKSDGTTNGAEKIKTILTSSIYIDVRILAGVSKIYVQFSNSPSETPQPFIQHWVSDGTTAGTINISSLNPNFSAGSYKNQIAVVGDTYYFTAYDATNGFELWKSDGTSVGTSFVKNINKSPASSDPKQFVALNNDVFFTANDIKYGREVWKTDGTTANTQLVADYSSGSDADVSYNSVISGMIAYNNMIIAYIGAGLVKFSSTLPPTRFYSHNMINPGDPEFIKYGNTLFYRGYDGSTGKYALYETNGNIAIKVKNISTVWDGGSSANFAIWGGLLYFLSDNRTKLWKSDGTEAGTVLVKNFSGGMIASKFFVVNDVLMFAYSGSTYGNELWKTDGTEAGTVLVKDINPGTAGASISKMVVYNNQLFFYAYNGTAQGFYKSDGTSANTVLFSSITPTNVPVVFKNKLFFLTYEIIQSSINFYLWSTDGISAPVKIQKVGDETTQNSQNIRLVNIEDKLLVFNIVTYFLKLELWASDGTVAGTKMMKVIRNKPTNDYDMNIPEFIYNNQKLYFAADDGVHGKELWVWDFTCPESMSITNDIAEDTDVKVNQYIVGSNKINAGIKASYNANKYIALNPGFETKSNAVFTASMSGCISLAASSGSTANGPIFQHFLTNETYKPTVIQFLNDPFNAELRLVYEFERSNNNDQNIVWIIDESPEKYILKMRVGEKEWIGYLQK